MKRRSFVLFVVASVAAALALVAASAASARSTIFVPPPPQTVCNDGVTQTLPFGGMPFSQQWAENIALTDDGVYYEHTGPTGPAWHYFTPNYYVLYGETVTSHLVKAGACSVTAAPVAVPGPPDRYGYCSVAGNTDAAGSPLAAGTFLNLEFGQPDTDSHYTGATPAFWVEGVGVTCDLTPAQAAIASASTSKVNHVGAKTIEEGSLFYTFVPKG